MPFIIGIAGGSASGKSTLAAVLAEQLAADETTRVQTLAMDRYVVADKSDGPSFVFSPTGETLFNWNHSDAFDTARLLRDMGDADADFLIVEGLMTLQAAAIRARLDLRLFVELEADLRALRRLLRDMKGGRASQDPQFIADYYRECARVGHDLYVEPSRLHADLIVRGDGDFTRLGELIAALARARRRHVS